MLLHLSYSDELIITKADFDTAVALLSQIEPKMLRVFQAVGKNPYTNEMDTIIEWFKNKQEANKKEFFSRFYHAAPPAILQDLLNALLTMGVITVGGDPNSPKYQYVNGKLPSRKASYPQFVTKLGEDFDEGQTD